VEITRRTSLHLDMASQVNVPKRQEEGALTRPSTVGLEMRAAKQNLVIEEFFSLMKNFV
jgi:hypothetical protein